MRNRIARSWPARGLALGIVVFLAATLAVAQGPGRGFAPPMLGPGFGTPGFGFGPGFGPGPGRGPGRGPHPAPITGLPFTATATFQSVHVNKSGSPVTETTAIQLARDSEGRTWMQVTSPPHGPNNTQSTVIYINDPVARVDYVVYPSRQMATKRDYPAPRDTSTNPPPNPPPYPGGRGGRGGNRPQPVVTQLPPQTIAGIQADGTQTVITLPARGNQDNGGNSGSGQPTTMTTVRYYSTTLQIVALESRTGPGGGQQTYQLQTLQQVEPDASLFTVPSNYTIRSARMRGFGRFGGRG